MSAWRREASERLPELQSIIASRDVDGPMMLWIDLQVKFDHLCREVQPPIDLIKRLWGYAVWCLEKGNDDARTAAALAFCEHLITSKASRSILPQIMSREDFMGLKELLLYHNPLEKYEEALKQFDFHK